MTIGRTLNCLPSTEIVQRGGWVGMDAVTGNFLWNTANPDNFITNPPVNSNGRADFFTEGAIAGAAAGVVVETALFPIDTIKTRLQAARSGGKIVFKGLYLGLAGNLADILPSTAGAGGGAAASLIRVPTEVVKQRMQTGQFPSAHSAVRVLDLSYCEIYHLMQFSFAYTNSLG